jgi:GH25 family lysozyme M1 (1,4-beta-N-acetylmuramidase)
MWDAFLPPDELHYLNEMGRTYKVFGPEYPWHNRYWLPVQLQEGDKVRLEMTIWGDWADFVSGEKVPKPDPHHAGIELFVGDSGKGNFIYPPFIDESTWSAEYVVPAGTHDVGFGIMTAFAPGQGINGVFVKHVKATVEHKNTSPPPPPPSSERPTGTDVSRWQGIIDWHKMAQEARFTFIKATDGTGWVDPNYARNSSGAATNGLLYGAYHYYKVAQDPISQANHFVNTVNNGNIPLAVDLEDTDGIPHDLGDKVVLFLQTVERLTGRKPIIYTGAWWWNPYMSGAEWAKEYDLWIARYTTREEPPIPSDWTTWTFWQFSNTGSGQEYGAESRFIDLNRFNGTDEDLHRYFRAEPRPEPTTIKLAVDANVRTQPKRMAGTVIGNGVTSAGKEFEYIETVEGDEFRGSTKWVAVRAYVHESLVE